MPAATGTSPAEIQQEAVKLQCDYILFTDITDVKTSKSGGIGGRSPPGARGAPGRDPGPRDEEVSAFANDKRFSSL